jgi:hypothetical protein
MGTGRATAILILVFCAGDSNAGELEWKREVLLSWVGKYPTSSVDNRKVSLFDERSVSHYLREILPEPERKRLDAYTVETPVERRGAFVVVYKCRPHNCPSEFGMIVLDLEKPRLWAGLFSRFAGRVSTRWYGNSDDYSVLPEEVRGEFLAKQGG